jgi:hypothetical protein
VIHYHRSQKGYASKITIYNKINGVMKGYSDKKMLRRTKVKTHTATATLKCGAEPWV